MVYKRKKNWHTFTSLVVNRRGIHLSNDKTTLYGDTSWVKNGNYIKNVRDAKKKIHNAICSKFILLVVTLSAKMYTRLVRLCIANG